MIDNNLRERLTRNWREVVNEVRQAEADFGRSPDSVKIIGVSKYVDTETTLALAESGCHDLGESRPQSLWQKAETEKFSADVHWHMIGHLQRNKVRRVIRHQCVIHSIDSRRVLAAVAEESESLGRSTSVLLEVNISGDDAKTGFAPDELTSVLHDLPIRGVTVLGLMAMAGWGTDSDDARTQFDATRELRDRLQQDSGVDLRELSMGMSGDFREAIAAGATMVRIGSRLFEGVVDRG